MRRQSGFISTRFHRAVSSGAKFHLMNMAQWKSAEQNKWLGLAEKGNGDGKPWKRKDLRRAIKESKPSEYPPSPPYSGVQAPLPPRPRVLPLPRAG